MKAPVGLLSDGAVLRSKMEGLCPDKFRHDAQNADNARKNTAFPPVCKKCAKVCRAPENEKSHEESYDSSWDFCAKHRDFSLCNFCTLCRILQVRVPIASLETVQKQCRNRALTLGQMKNNDF